MKTLTTFAVRKAKTLFRTQSTTSSNATLNLSKTSAVHYKSILSTDETPIILETESQKQRNKPENFKRRNTELKSISRASTLSRLTTQRNISKKKFLFAAATLPPDRLPRLASSPFRRCKPSPPPLLLPSPPMFFASLLSAAALLPASPSSSPCAPYLRRSSPPPLYFVPVPPCSLRFGDPFAAARLATLPCVALPAENKNAWLFQMR